MASGNGDETLDSTAAPVAGSSQSCKGVNPLVEQKEIAARVSSLWTVLQGFMSLVIASIGFMHS